MTETVQSALQRATAMLGMAGIEGAQHDARALLAHVMKVDRAQLNLRLTEAILPSESHGLDQAIAMRSNARPVSHIIGKRSFWQHDFLVNGDVLDPRPETEAIVALALEKPFSTLLDLGTGSGVIALSLLDENALATGVATDISDRALDVARRNAGRIGVSDRVEFILSDWFADITGQYDLIVSNPPYISTDEMTRLSPDVHDWEPHLALTPGGDGLASYRVIARQLTRYLAPKGRAIFEIGYRQASAVKAIFMDSGHDNVKVYKDLNGLDRVIAINCCKLREIA